MLSVKIPIRVMAACLCLLLAAASPVVARESPFEPLPTEAKVRLGRGTAATVQYSPDGTRLAVGGSMGIWLYDTRTYEVEYPLKGHPNGVVGLEFGPNGRILASFGPDVWTPESGGRAGTVLLWDAVTGTLRHTLEGHRKWVTSVAFSPDGRTLASRDGTPTIRLWDVATGTLRHIPVVGCGLGCGRGGLPQSGDQSRRALGGMEERNNGDHQLRQPARARAVPCATGSAAVIRAAGSLPAATRVTHTVTGMRVDADGKPVSDAQPAIFDLTIDTNGEMRYVDNPKMDGLGYVDYCVMDLTWQTRDASETGEPSASGTESPGR